MTTILLGSTDVFFEPPHLTTRNGACTAPLDYQATKVLSVIQRPLPRGQPGHDISAS